jgi:hypothetical protein
LNTFGVEQGLVVVVLDVVHHLARLAGVAGRLAAVVDGFQRQRLVRVGVCSG